MTNHQIASNKFEQLRLQAEKLIQDRPDINAKMPADIIELIHELKIHQAELEIQNEELQRAQQELSKLHQKYEDLYEFAPCGYLTINSKGIITHINLTGTTLLGINRKLIRQLSFSQLIDLGWEDTYLSARAKSAETNEKQSVELPLKQENALPLWVRADIDADCDKSGVVMQWRMVLLDITAEKEAEATLQRSETKFRKMMESMTDPVYVCSSTLTIKYMNPAMIKRIGRDATGNACYKALHGLDKACEWCQVEDVRNGKTMEMTVESPLDKRIYRIASMPIVEHDHTISKMTIYKDITDYIKAVAEKEKTQIQLIQSQKMESIGTLAGGIAHDFNNILSSIIGFTELALDDAESGSSLADNLQEIYASGKRARDLVSQILSFARQSQAEIQPIQMNKTVEECLKFIRSTIPTTIKIKPDIKNQSVIMGNPVQIHQVLMNLCTNAAHAMEEAGGFLEIGLNDIFIDQNLEVNRIGLSTGDYIELKVSDTGTGISPDIMDKIFDPYYTTKGVGKGTGMGLALAYGIIESYGGKIMVESELGKGSTFRVYLPIFKQALSPIHSHKTETLPTGTERILLVDDEIPITKMGKQVLEKKGYSVQTSNSSMEALELFRAKPDEFDLIITDMTMPDMTGDKLALEFMHIKPGIPVILCTGYSNKISDKVASSIGINAFAYKPVAKADLLKTVRKVLDEAKGPVQ